MPRPKSPVPTYRLHKQSGQAVVTVTANGRRKDILLGKYDSPESKEEYRGILDNLAAGRFNAEAPPDLTVNELCSRYLKHAEGYYIGADGKPTKELEHIKTVIRAFRLFAGDMLAREFGPLAFKQLREQMVEKGWSRSHVNRQAEKVKRIVRWAVENELLPADRWEALRAVRGLAAGRTTAREPEPVQPVDEAHFRAVLPKVPLAVGGILELMFFTGMRPAEACSVRPCDIDKTGAVWLYRPANHKNKWRGKTRTVPIGQRAREVLERFAPADESAFYFSPQRTVEAKRAEAAANRKTPATLPTCAGTQRSVKRNHAERREATTRLMHSLLPPVVAANARTSTTGIPTSFGTCSPRECERCPALVWKPHRCCWATPAVTRLRCTPKRISPLP